MSTWTLSQGAGGSWSVPIVDAAGAAIAYVGTEALSGDLWPGGTRASLVTLTPTWLNPSVGTTALAIGAASTAGLAPAIYSIRLKVVDRTYYLGKLQILASPGTAVAPPTYTDDDDLRTYAPWIDALQADGEQAGFALQCGQARTWLDSILVSRWRPTGGLTLGDPGYGSFLNFGGEFNDTPSKWLKDQLAANKLIVTDQTKEIVAKRALYYICKAQLGRNGDHSYQDLARGFQRESEEMLKTYRGEIDLDGSGWASFVINCGASSLR
jgi:hypothetical protein